MNSLFHQLQFSIQILSSISFSPKLHRERLILFSFFIFLCISHFLISSQHFLLPSFPSSYRLISSWFHYIGPFIKANLIPHSFPGSPAWPRHLVVCVFLNVCAVWACVQSCLRGTASNGSNNCLENSRNIRDNLLFPHLFYLSTSCTHVI